MTVLLIILTVVIVSALFGIGERGFGIAVVLAVGVLLLAGCTAVPVEHVATCKIPVTRDAGMGVRLPDCVYWQIGKDFPQP